MHIVNRLTLVLLIAALGACSTGSGEGTDVQGDHVWKTQTDALEKARQVEGLMDEAAGRQLRAVD